MLASVSCDVSVKVPISLHFILLVVLPRASHLFPPSSLWVFTCQKHMFFTYVPLISEVYILRTLVCFVHSALFLIRKVFPSPQRVNCNHHVKCQLWYSSSSQMFTFWCNRYCLYPWVLSKDKCNFQHFEGDYLEWTYGWLHFLLHFHRA